MRRKVTIPESQHEIPLRQYQKWAEIVQADESRAIPAALDIFTSLTEAEQARMSIADRDAIYAQLDPVLNAAHSLSETFEFNGTTYGFIPCLEDITMGEYTDAERYLPDVANWHRFLAVCYRPVTKKAGKTYEIEEYRGSDVYAEIMRHVPMSVMTGVSVFFYHLGNDLLPDTPGYSIPKSRVQPSYQQRRSNSQRIGGGTHRSTQSRRVTSFSTMKS